jgi:hypothetical protein
MSEVNNMAVTMMRSRFQPFTKGHYEAIRSYYLYRKNKPDLNLPEKLVLCIIRDFDTVRMAQHRTGDKLVTGAETDDELALIFRHLDFFNPFSAYEVIEQIQHSLHCFATEDELTYQDPDYEKFVDGIMIVLCPLKFGELLEAVRKEDFAPRHLERHVNNVRNRVMEVLQQKTVESSLQKELNEAFEESKEELMNNVLNTWARFIRDLLPKEPYSQVYWLMPIFDQEDLNDFNMLKSSQMNFSAYYIIMDGYKYDCIPDLLGRGHVGLYGFFMQYILLLLVQERVIATLRVAPAGGWSASINAQEKVLRKLLCSHCLDQYQRKVENKLGFVSQTWDRLVPEDREKLINSLNGWSEDYVSQVRKISSEPYHTLIALVNFLMKSRGSLFENVVKQILYPDPDSIESLDDQFKIPLQTMSGTIVGWLRAAINRWRREPTLTSNQRKALARVDRLVNTIEERNLERQIRLDEYCLDYCRKLAKAVCNLQVENIHKFTTEIEGKLNLRRGWGFWRRRS